MSITSVLRLRAETGQPGPLETLVDRVQALQRFVDVARNHVPAQTLAAADAVLARAGSRLALSREHTVVALAGATGSGRSSIFNAVARTDLSTVGHRRPTTARTHACVWGYGQAGGLLDWLGVGPRFGIDDEQALRGGQHSLRGLVLLDLPDFDSIERSHRVEVDRLVALADLVIWVLDPQKYADRVLHHRYLNRFRRHRDMTAVVLNQADRLRPPEVEGCLADLARLLEEDGLGGVPLFATSTTGPPGVRPLRLLLERTVATRTAALRRTAADLDAVVSDLAPLMAAPPPSVADAADALTDSLVAAAGVSAIASATATAYARAAVRGTVWPLARPTADPPALDGPVWMPSAIERAVRSFGGRAGGELAGPWRAAVLDAALSGLPLDGALREAAAVASAQRALGWRVVGVVQLLLALTAVAGLVWLALTERRAATTLAVAAAVAGLVLATLARPAIAIASSRRRRRTADEQRAAVAEVGERRVVEPVEAVLRAYAEARSSLDAAHERSTGPAFSGKKPLSARE